MRRALPLAAHCLLLPLGLLLTSAASADAPAANAAALGTRAADLPPAGSYELPPIGRVGEYWLLDETGSRVPLLGLAPGQVALVSLIYTHCPAACPAALSIVQQVDREVARDPGLRESVRLVTVSFDPGRDTPVKMGALRERLAPRSDWRFITAEDEAAIRPVLEAFDQDALRLVLKSDDRDEEQMTPLLRHVLKLFLVDAAGDIRNIYSSGLLSSDLLMADIRTLLMTGRIARGGPL